MMPYGLAPMPESEPEYDPWGMQAAQTRARYPTRLPDPASLAASQGAVGFSDLPGFDQARQQAMNVYAGEDYNPASVFQMAMGAVGAPGMAGGVPQGALGSGVGRGIRAYHGSPYDFERFDLSRIGTGEGAQAYGHGLYFAEHEPVAASYKNATRVTDMDWPVVGGDPNWRVPAWVARTAQNSPRSLDEVRANFAGRVEEARTARPENVRGLQDIVDALDAVKAGKAELKKPGYMYEVNIRAEPEQFLNYDVPLAQQSQAVRGALSNVPGGKYILENADPLATRPITGREAYNIVTGQMSLPGGEIAPRIRGNDEAMASAALREAGIPGLRYLDQGSRAGGQGTSNYVLFRDDIIDILRKYGLIGGAALPYGLTPPDKASAGEAQFFQPQQLPEGLTEADVSQALHGPGWEKIRGTPEHRQLQDYPDMSGLHIDPMAWEAFLRNAPHSRNIEDRRGR